jgi:hypothetical protein
MFGEDLHSDQLHVPANHFISLGMACGEAKNRQYITFYVTHVCGNLELCQHLVGNWFI